MIVYLAFFCGAAVIGVPMFIWLSWSGRLYTKAGTHSASHNSAITPCLHVNKHWCSGGELWCFDCHTCLES